MEHQTEKAPNLAPPFGKLLGFNTGEALVKTVESFTLMSVFFESRGSFPVTNCFQECLLLTVPYTKGCQARPNESGKPVPCGTPRGLSL